MLNGIFLLNEAIAREIAETASQELPKLSKVFLIIVDDTVGFLMQEFVYKFDELVPRFPVMADCLAGTQALVIVRQS